ncbi:MAG: hypothetical protein DMD40_03815 [Gemmatimonadetes bacterium]|nr:MAG: hypothetical protein DMD40_03815 [Gemmatimonadota bacterium]
MLAHRGVRDRALGRLASDGNWIVVTESREFADALEAVALLQDAKVTRREFPMSHEASPESLPPLFRTLEI